MKDLRDPSALGTKLLCEVNGTHCAGLSASEVYDRFDFVFENAPNYVDPPVIERYGDPVAQHEAKIDAGLAARLP